MSRSNSARRFRAGHVSDQPAFTLVEMLIAVAITLVMMAAVVTLFANITESVRKRRATMEMTVQLRHVRNVLQQDLEGHTCPGVTWQRPESNVGYIELIEGYRRDAFPSMLTDGDNDSDGNGNPDLDGDGVQSPDELDPKLSLVPRGNGGTFVQRDAAGKVIGTANALGDYDDIIMLTTRNEYEPFVSRTPDYDPSSKGYTSVESPLAEVIWFAIENPQQEERAKGFFGEPGMRTIYRRALVIAPWLDPYGAANVANSHPGVMRLLDPTKFTRTDCDKALAALIAFQDQYDLSVRLEWDGLARNGAGQWKIIANTLSDLTKRENRFLHYQYGRRQFPQAERRFPYSIVSVGSNGFAGTSTQPVKFVVDPEQLPTRPGSASAIFKRWIGKDPYVTRPGTSTGDYLAATFTVAANSYDPITGPVYPSRPFAYVDAASDVDATANVVLNDDGRVVRVLSGPVPLWGGRRGEDVMLTDALAFDLRVFDPGAPLFLESTTNTILEPADPKWQTMTLPSSIFPFTASGSGTQPVAQGAYVDMSYNGAFGGYGAFPDVPRGTPWIVLCFADRGPIFENIWFHRHLPAVSLTPGYSIYDTWSYSYENNGIDEDHDGVIDQGTDGRDDFDPNTTFIGIDFDSGMYGSDDLFERETHPPYEVPLRGIQVILRAYERDSRQIRQVRVSQHFLTE